MERGRRAPPPRCARPPEPTFVLRGKEVVHPLGQVHALLAERVPGVVLADALLERAALAAFALLDVADLARDAGQVARGRLAAPPVVVLGGGETSLLPGSRVDPGEQLRPVGDVVALAHDHRTQVPVVVPVDVVVTGLELRRVGDLRRDAFSATPAAEALGRSRVEDVDAGG